MTDTTHTYICKDGVTRTRCRAHIPTKGPTSPHPTAHQATETPTKSCIQCGPKPDPSADQE